jgi:hypothetical protein
MSYHSQLGLDMTIGDWEEEKRLDRREWSMNVWNYPKPQPPLGTVGYLSGMDLDVMSGWEMKDRDGHLLTWQEAARLYAEGGDVEMVQDGKIRDVISVDEKYGQTWFCLSTRRQ